MTRIADGGEISVMPIDAWLAVVRNATAPRKLERKDEVVAIDVSGNLALVKLRPRMPPRSFTDLLSCLKVQVPGGSFRR